jgi:hypothetical protein
MFELESKAPDDSISSSLVEEYAFGSNDTSTPPSNIAEPPTIRPASAVTGDVSLFKNVE